jgi:hypothetical protein
MFGRVREVDIGCCPTCRHRFRNILDFPCIYVRAFERLPAPEAIDQWSREARSRRPASSGREADQERRARDGINATPEIAAALDSEPVRAYFRTVTDLIRHEVSPARLLPPWESHSYFRHSFPVPGTRFLFSIHEADDSSPSAGVAEITILCDGINFGSGGGPTLQVLGPVARIGYRGILEGGAKIVETSSATNSP